MNEGALKPLSGPRLVNHEETLKVLLLVPNGGWGESFGKGSWSSLLFIELLFQLWGYRIQVELRILDNT